MSDVCRWVFLCVYGICIFLVSCLDVFGLLCLVLCEIALKGNKKIPLAI